MARAACLLRAISRALLLQLPLLLLLLLLLLPPPLMARPRPPVSARRSSPREGWARGLGPLVELDPQSVLATLAQWYPKCRLSLSGFDNELPVAGGVQVEPMRLVK